MYTGKHTFLSYWAKIAAHSLSSSSTSSDVYSVWSEFIRSRQQATPIRSCPTCLDPSELSCTLPTWSFSTDPQPGTRACSASILAPNLLSGGSSHIPCSSVTTCGELKLNPHPGSVRPVSPAPCPSQWSTSCLRPYSEAYPTTLATNKTVPSRNSILYGRVFAARSHVSYFSSLSLANTGLAIKGIEFIIILKYTHSFEIALCSSPVCQKRLKNTHNVKLKFISLFSS